MRMMLFVLVGLIVLVRSASVTPSAKVPLSSEFQKFLEVEINDDSVPTGFKQICSAICNNELHVVQTILDSDEFWKDYPDDMLIVPEDIATAKLLLISHMEGQLEICKIILGCPRFTVPISMPLNCPELALIVACRNEGNEDFIVEYLEEQEVPMDILDKCIGLAQYHEDDLYLQIFFRSEVNIRYDDLPCQIRKVKELGFKNLAKLLTEYYRYLLYFLLCRDIIGCSDISTSLWKELFDHNRIICPKIEAA